MLKSLMSITFLFFITSLFAQEIKYVSPNSIEHSKVSINLEDIKSTSGYVYAKIKGKNKSNGYFFCDLKKTSFTSPKKGSAYPTFGKILVPPNSQRSALIKEVVQKVISKERRMKVLQKH